MVDTNSVLVFDAPYENVGGTDINVDAAGEYVVIGARQGLLIIDLKAPFQPVKRLHRQSKSSSQTVVQWHTNLNFRDYLGSSTNKTILVWNLEAGTRPLEATLQHHTRVISDFAWSSHVPTTLLSTDVGGELMLWDIRSPRTPQQTYRSPMNGISQLEWNRFDEFSFASTHETVLHVWDTRMGGRGVPLCSTAASGQQICGLDWCQTSRHELLTCGMDKSIHFWNIGTGTATAGTTKGMTTHNITPIASVHTATPVWRARYTPFGHGFVSISRSNDDPTLRLWSLEAEDTYAADLVSVYYGHRGAVKAFSWRASTKQQDAHQLVSWGTDGHLLVNRVDSTHLQERGGG